MFIPVLAHIAGVPVEETLLSVGPALVAAVSVSLVHIRSFRNPGALDDDEDESVEDGDGDGDPDDPADLAAPSRAGDGR